MEDAVVVELGHRDLGLEVALVDPAGREAAADDDVTRRERGGRVAAPVAAARDDILGDGLVRGELLGAATDRRVLRLAGRAGLLGRPLEAGPRRAGRDRPIEVEDRFEQGRLDQDEGGRIGRGLGRLGDHERDRLAGPQDLAPGERLVETVRAFGDDRQVGGGQDRDDAGDRERRRGIDPLDQRMGREGEHRSGVEERREPRYRPRNGPGR